MTIEVGQGYVCERGIVRIVTRVEKMYTEYTKCQLTRSGLVNFEPCYDSLMVFECDYAKEKINVFFNNETNRYEVL